MADAPLFSLFVPGVPQPAGSKRAIPLFAHGRYLTDRKTGRPLINVVDDNPASDTWKRHVKGCARDAWASDPLDEPLALTLVFFMDRPQYHFGRRQGQSYLKADAPLRHRTKPDALKLARAVEDALTGVLYVDDALIVEEHLRKNYGARAGVAIFLRRAPEPAPLIELAAAQRSA